MKIGSLRTLALAGLVAASFFVDSKQASAANVGFSIQVGTPPPPPRADYHRWPPPYRSAVWIPGHNEWINGRWVWVGGYYGYPPRPGAHWVPGRYKHGYYYPGHWA